MTTSSSVSLTDALCHLLETTSCLQDQVLKHVTALACARTPTDDNAEESTTPPLWSYPAGHPPYPHASQPDSMPQFHISRAVVDAEKNTPSGTVLGLIEMVLVLDVFEVAQASPDTCCALFCMPPTSLDVAASAAVQEWLCLYVCDEQTDVHGGDDVFARGRNADRAVERACAVEASISRLPWPAAWWSALAARQVECNVRVLLLRTPSVYAALTSDGDMMSDCLLHPRSSTSTSFNTAPTPVRDDVVGRRSNSLAGLSAISVPPTEEGRLPSLTSSSRRLSGSFAVSAAGSSVASTVAARPSYPSDSFLEIAPEVHVVGVVQQICFENRRALSPAPWVTLLLLLPHANVPVRREVNLSSLYPCAVRAAAVMGEVIEVCGRTHVARRQTSGRAGGGRGCAETLLRECILASWAAPVLLSLPQTPSFASALTGHVIGAFSDLPTPPAVYAASPIATTTVVPYAVLQPARQTPFHDDASMSATLRYGDSFFHKMSQDMEEVSVAELSGWEEEWATRAALTCWEGARLALGVELNGTDNTLTASAFFSTSLDVVLSAQLTIFSAQMSDGVVLLLVDEAPESLVTQMFSAFDRAAPTATLEFPSSTLCRASPSFLLPSYRVQRVPAPVRLAQRPPVAPDNDAMRPPAVRRFFQRSRTNGPSAAAAVAAPPPPFYPEVLKGGALTNASGRALVLQGIEVIPAATLKVLQEALRAARHDGGDVDGTAVGAGTAAAAVRGVTGIDGTFHSFENTSRPPHITETAATTADAPLTESDGARHVVQREGGQYVKYRVAHAAVCSVRHGARLAEKSHLFEFAQRCDVVVRPAYDRRRQAAALQAAVDAPFQHLLRRRQATWLSLLGAAFAFPTKLHDTAAGAAGMGDMSATPTLTEPCNRLLSSYFIAAKALCQEGTDASVMTTLVKLTVTHAQWRCNLTELRLRERTSRSTGGTPRGCVGAAARRPPRATALIDAVVAVGLCDATLHFFTAKALFGECVLRLLEKEAWPIWEAEAGEGHRGALPDPAMQTYGGDEDDEMRVRPPLSVPRGASTEVQQLCQQVEFRSRCCLESFSSDHVPPRPSAFSIQHLVQDLIDHLERVTHNVASSTGAQQ
ncbi:hypothetical protein ABB37_07598 [Leptomonas pyrrhocoris]|uniref:Uncharacterized protein n=1 Tax=Leptomonas pyrrhocoris TaxID=157538 RepID=A0A0M9FVG1_LEPPY|nr:hypothetical protein ABB37_07598 [Leptomonas pyrrhocoris]XP_015655217.1 hypothetical protein ABB37_07598 [Leptomonas pyrrhocoris]KPA76777.1 hypothetical protein ABB37_07598 [Leptomonas pyrrhocoris]KPA76778.1 hypothetical protein ABB37_07598 [Leptomonas pyrrhocoris]|eukprot:XP_015655216.1 hypothetical protein ABB37_07598 [Leptomonas pyrrhocoris]